MDNIQAEQYGWVIEFQCIEVKSQVVFIGKCDTCGILYTKEPGNPLFGLELFHCLLGKLLISVWRGRFGAMQIL